MANLEEIRRILSSGEFDQLIGKSEDDQIEFKKSPYQLEDKRQKAELAKDVSAMANVRGGIILIGVETHQDPALSFEVATRIRSLPEERCNKATLSNVLEGWMYPQIVGLNITWHPSQSDTQQGIVCISIPEESAGGKPYVVTTVLDDSGKEIGTLLGYFERSGTSITHLSSSELRDKLKDGSRFSEIDGKLGGIEAMVASVLSRLPQGAKVSSSGNTGNIVLAQQAPARIREARHAVGLDADPTFWLAAWSLEPTRFEDLFQSQEAPPVRLLREPPQHREAGFDLSTRRAADNIEGLSRRCVIHGSKVLQLWQDGFLVFATQGNDGRLGWAMRSDATTGQRINNIALTEMIYIFCELALQLFALPKPAPSRLTIQLGFSNLRLGDRLACLSPYRPNDFNLWDGWREAPRDAATFEITFALLDQNPGAISYSLISKVYSWFGFEEEQVPYADRASNPPLLDYQRIVGRP